MDLDSGTVAYRDPDSPSPTNNLPDHRIQSPESQTRDRSPASQRRPRSPTLNTLQSRRSQSYLRDSGSTRRPTKQSQRLHERPISIRKRSSTSDLHRPSSWTDGRLHHYLSSAFQEAQPQIQHSTSPPRSSSSQHTAAPVHTHHEFELALRQINNRPALASRVNPPVQPNKNTYNQIHETSVAIPSEPPREAEEKDDSDAGHVDTILEVDEGYCETEDSLSWLDGERNQHPSIKGMGKRPAELRQYMALKYRRSYEAAMQCPTVVRNVPRMRRRRRKETDLRRRSLAASETSEIDFLRTPSPVSMP